MKSGLWPPNPFSPGAAFATNWLAGRRKALDTLRTAVRDNWPLAVVQGPRGIGKTSLVQRLLAEDHVRGVFVDLRRHVPVSDIRHTDAALQGVIRGILEEISYRKQLPPQIEPTTCTPQQFHREVLSTLNEEAGRWVFALDEVDLLDQGPRRALINLAARGRELRRPPLWILTLGAAWGKDEELSRTADTLAIDPDCVVRLDPLSMREIGDLLDKLAAGELFAFDQAAGQAICEETAGYPLFVSAMLDAIYSTRWDEDDQSEIHLKDVTNAISRFERLPPKRVRHALEQAGPAALLVLHTLSQPGREELSTLQLAEEFSGTWGAWKSDLAGTLQTLNDSWLLRHEGGLWSHGIPLLRGLISRMDREEFAPSDQPPRPDAWEALSRGEHLEAEGEWKAALNAYVEAQDLDEAFWEPRWRRTRLLSDRARARDVSPRERAALLEEALQLVRGLGRELDGRAKAQQAARLLHRDILVDIARSQNPASERRKIALTELRDREVDYWLETEGAKDLVAETAIADWIASLKTKLPGAWRNTTRRLFRESTFVGVDLVWKEMAQWVTDQLDELAPDSPPGLDGLELVRRVVPVLLDERPPGAESERHEAALWGALVAWLGRNQSDSPDVRLEPDAWETVLTTAPAHQVQRLEILLAPWLRSDLSRALECGNEAASQRLSRIVLSTTSARGASRQRAWPALEKELLGALDDLLLRAFDDAALRGYLVSSLAPTLTYMADSGLEIEDQLSLYLETWRGVGADERIAVSPAVREAWKKLELPERLTELGRHFLDRLISAASKRPDDPIQEDEQALVQSGLRADWNLERRVALPVLGFSSDEVQDDARAYRAKRGVGGSESVALIRYFRLRSPNSETNETMWWIWERERRVLETLSGQHAGRALPRLLDARSRADWPGTKSGDVLLLATEWVGSRTLRDEIQSAGPCPPEKRLAFWHHFIAVLEAVDALHERGFLHRSISPAVLYVANLGANGSLETKSGEPWRWLDEPASAVTALRLCHFEWSLYVRELSRLGRFRKPGLSRYDAPEAIRARLGIKGEPRGETCASDIYALGLTLFECLIRLLSKNELLAPSSDDDFALYENEHRGWLEALRQEVATARANGRIELLEEEILSKLLWFDLHMRPARLGSVLRDARAFADAPTRIATPLPAFTTLARTPGMDPRRDFTHVAFFLQRQLPEVANADEARLRTDLPEILETDLRAARVYHNRRHLLATDDQLHSQVDPIAPLLLVSRTGTRYRLKPLHRFEGYSSGVSRKSCPQLAFLEVSRDYQGDEETGGVLAILDGGVQMHSVGPDQNAFIDRYTEAGWSSLFQRVDDLRGQRRGEELERWAQAAGREDLLRFLQLSMDVEYEIAWKEADFVRDQQGSLLLRSANPLENLAAVVAAWLYQDLRLEVAHPRDAPGSAIEIGLSESALDLEAGVVDLAGAASEERGTLDPDRLPLRGVLRPSFNRGTVALYRRRRRVHYQLRDDTRLLAAVNDPVGATMIYREGKPRTLFVPDLDEDKRLIVEQYRKVRPLLAVQGPPGTGKTTLATEILLQTLDDNANARILITAQGHSPLDNMLERVVKELGGGSRASDSFEQTEIVRIPSGSRSQPEDHEPNIRRFLPYERAARLFERLRASFKRQDGEGSLEAKVARLLRDELGHQMFPPESLCQRLIESANLVFVTSSAKEIEDALPGAFDLVVIEEAARCVPMELLGAMRLAKQWVLIGDHQQLPPFGFEQVLTQIGVRLDDEEARLLRTGPTTDAGREIQALQQLRDAVPRNMELFKRLHQAGSPQPSQPSSAATGGSGDAAKTRHPIAAHAETLKTQWRMHPFLGEMVSQVFYGGRAVINPKGNEETSLARRRAHPFREPRELRNCQLVWIDFDPASEVPICGEQRGPGGSIENAAERRATVAFLRQLQTLRPQRDVAVLTPYRYQAEQFRGLLGEYSFDAFGQIADRVFTVDSFQGRQAGTVVLSLVRNNDSQDVRPGIGFLAEKRRATVMFSRTERLLIVLGCSQHFKRFPETRWLFEEVFEERAKARGLVLHWTQLLDSRQIAALERKHRVER